MQTQMFAAALAAALAVVATPVTAHDRDGNGRSGYSDHGGSRGGYYGDGYAQNDDHGLNRGYARNDGYRGNYAQPQRAYYSQSRDHQGDGYRGDGYRRDDYRDDNYGNNSNHYYPPRGNYGGSYYAPRDVVYNSYVYNRPRYRANYYPPAYFARRVIVQQGYYGAPIGYGGGYGGGYYSAPAVAQVNYGGQGYYGDQGYENQGYYGGCSNNHAAGTIIGAIAGGIIGNGVAGYRDRGLGTIVGAGVGAVAGGAIANNRRCY